MRFLNKLCFRRLKKGTDKEMNLTDYSIYVMTVKEKLLYILSAAAVIYVTVFIFYRSHIISILFLPLAFFYPGIRTKEIINKRRCELNIQFKDMLYSLSSSLSAGKSVEKAFGEILNDLAILYPNPDTDILKEVRYIIKKLELNETIETALSDFARRARLDDIDNFTDVFHTCKRAGGNLVQVIGNTTNIINDKIEIQQEIDTLLAERRMEQKILNILPVGLVLLLSISAADYIEPVFNTAAGKIVMSISLLLLAGAYLISRKIMNIKV